MKRLFCATWLFLFLLLTSCYKTEPAGSDTPSHEATLRSFSAEIVADYESTKALVDISTRKVSFEDGDQVAVSNGSSIANYTYSAASGKFTSDSPLTSAEHYTAFYPASACTGAGTDGGLRILLPDSRTYDAASVLEAPMGAESDGGVFSFKNLCTIVHFTMEDDGVLSRVCFSASVPVCGAASFRNGLLTMEEGGSREIGMTLPESFSPDASKPVCLVVPAQIYTGGFTLKSEFVSGRVWYQSMTRDQALKAGYFTIMELFTTSLFSGGIGTEADPYRIASAADLQDLSSRVASTAEEDLPLRTACYRQMADIDFLGATLPSIGNSNDGGGCYFEGRYEGNGHTISNLTISNPNTNKANGFFGYLSGNAHIDGLQIDRAAIASATWNNGIVVGCVQPGSNAVVENCTVTHSSVSSNNSDNGGIIGKLMSGTVRNCSFSGTVSGTASAKHQCAGIVGEVTGAGCLVADCRFDGTVTGACGNVAGIVGSLAGTSSVTGCTVSAGSVIEGGSITNNGINIGGIVGYINGSTGGKVEKCTCAGTVIGHYYDIGGIAGRDQGIPIRDCTFSGTVTSDYDDRSASGDLFSRIGGICGHIHGTAAIEGCSVSGTVGESTAYVGGIVGWMETGSITACRVENAQVKGRTCIGGIAGRFKGGIVKTCTVSSLNLSASGNYAGGAAGWMMAGCSLTGCLLEQSSVSGDMSIGGMCGLYSGGGYIGQCRVRDCRISTQTKLAGGILGNMTSSSDPLQSRVERCSVTGGSVGATTGLAGGILGGCDTKGIINLCSASTDVSNTGSGNYGNVGGIAGWCSTTDLLIANCVYFDGELRNDNATGGCVGGICGSMTAGTLGYSAVVNCCAFPGRLSTGSGNANLAGIIGYMNTVTVRNAYSPAPASVMYFNGAASGASRGSIYGWLRGVNTSDACSGIVEDAYWLSGFKAGNYNGNYKYVKSEQALTDSQMRNNGAVSRPSAGTSSPDFLSALNAAADAWNAGTPTFGVRAEEWVMGTGGYPVPYGTLLAGDTPGSSKKRVSLLGDSITTYKGYTLYPGNGQYPNANYSDFTSVSQTWWYQLIYNKMSHAVLEANSSYTGTCVQNTTSKGHPGYGFLQRYVDLGRPDVILVNGGTNDAWSYGLPAGSLDFTLATEALDTYQFAQAYDKLIRLLRETYPAAQICCIIGDNVMDASKTAYAQVIRDVCKHYGLPYAEVVFADRAASTYDNVHPNVSGMADMAGQIYTQLKERL